MNYLTLLKFEVRRLLLKKQNILILIAMIGMSYYGFDMTCELAAQKLCHDWRDDALSKMNFAYSFMFTNFILLITVILICASVFSEKESRVKRILLSAPISENKYYAIKSCAIGITFIIIFIVQIIIYGVLYGYRYHFYKAYELILPGVAFVIPSAMLVFSIAMVICRINSKILYLFIPVFYYLGDRNYIDLPHVLDLCGNNYFVTLEAFLKMKSGAAMGNLTSKDGLALSWDFICSRWIYVAVSIILFAVMMLRPLSRIMEWRRENGVSA